jgi:hypothetical protein
MYEWLFFVCVKCCVRGSVGHSSGSLPASWHPRLLWEHSVAPRSSGIVPLFPVRPSLQEGCRSRRIQGSLASFFLRWGISGSGLPRASTSHHLHTSLKVTTPRRRMNERTWVTIPWRYNLCHFPSLFRFPHLTAILPWYRNWLRAGQARERNSSLG